jgi:hypothetical protein
MPDRVEEAFDAYIENQPMAQIEDYLKHGRHLVGVGGDELKSRWIAEFRKWAANYGKGVDHRDRKDIEAELGLRGEQPPHDLVKPELAALRAASKADDERRDRDPANLSREAQKLTDKIDAFLQSGKGKPLN